MGTDHGVWGSGKTFLPQLRKTDVGGVLLEGTAVVGRGQQPRVSLLERSAVGPQNCWKKSLYPTTKENCLRQESLRTAGFLWRRERPSIFIAINSVNVGFTKENGGNHLVICSSAETSLSISVPGWTRGPGLLCCLCQELNIAICNFVSQRLAS